MKSWLGFTRSESAAIIHQNWHISPAFIIHLTPWIDEITSISLSNLFMRQNGIPLEAKSIITMAVNSVNSINRQTLPKATRTVYKDQRERFWSSHLNSLLVQRKFGDVCTLEKENRVWARIMDGLSAGQLSFILRAASDTLPTPLNLKRWKQKVDSKCMLIKATNCIPYFEYPTALLQGRYTWRYDSVLLWRGDPGNTIIR